MAADVARLKSCPVTKPVAFAERSKSDPLQSPSPLRNDRSRIPCRAHRLCGTTEVALWYRAVPLRNDQSRGLLRSPWALRNDRTRVPLQSPFAFAERPSRALPQSPFPLRDALTCALLR